MALNHGGSGMIHGGTAAETTGSLKNTTETETTSDGGTTQGGINVTATNGTHG